MSKKTHPFKFLIFSFLPVLVLLLTGEIMCRIKYFLLHDEDWNYIIAPLRVQDTEAMDHGAFMPPDEGTQKSGQIKIKWYKPCRDRNVFSEECGKWMPRTYDEYCFRGDRVTLKKDPTEFLIFVLGGSTVEDICSDEEMMTTKLKLCLPTVYKNKHIKVINAGHSAYDSKKILRTYTSKIIKFQPDVVLYQEACNEQNSYSRWFDINGKIGNINNRLHHLLYYKSMLYTYLVEKYYFITLKKRRLWTIDLEGLKGNLLELNREVGMGGAKFIFITQPVDMPRFFKGVDTFRWRGVLTRIQDLKNDPQYTYDTAEISFLNQRLAVLYSLDICKENNIPVINILDEIEKLDSVSRSELFYDQVHRTIKGNRAIGRLIGDKLRALLEK